MFFSIMPAICDARQRPLHIVMNDRGGVVSQRQQEIEAIRISGSRVEIRGAVCLSSCTMFLGSPDVCVSPKTRFGFHGPTDHGRPLNKPQFDYWSKIIASHYPTALSSWYMRIARHRTSGYYSLTGAQLIEMGFKSC
ncbi:hypothetical protein [Thalassovita sp.]|uniref:hypothetical protein n=1 Tax=Thalassovita sp. TaxID=1979401 RepID=UPI0029DE6E4C|nr:hypothetical protein [Thalassovita sp.]